jgi:hypothetical protein
MGWKALWKKLRSVFGDPVKWAVASDMTLSQLQGMPNSFKDDLHVGLVWGPLEAEITRRTAPST